MWFPVLTAVGLIVLAILGAVITHVGSMLDARAVADLGPLWSTIVDADAAPETGAHRAMSIAGLVFYLGSHVLTVALGVAMTHAALESLAGRSWTVRQALAVAKQRRSTVIGYAVIRATVGRLLHEGGGRGRRGQRRKPGLLRRLAGVAWWAATYLVLPVIAREPRGSFGAIARSAKLLRETWRDTLVARLTLAWLWIPAVIIAAIPAVVCAALGVREPSILAIVLGLPAMLLVGFALVLHTLDGIYRAALYTYAAEGVVPELFDDDALHEVWEVRSEDDAPGDEPTDESGRAVLDVDAVEADVPAQGPEHAPDADDESDDSESRDR